MFAGTASSSFWIWQDGSTHFWQDGTPAQWQTGIPFPGDTGMLGEDGDPLQWEDGEWLEWEPDTIPDAFSFTDITDAETSTYYVSDTITVAGIDAVIRHPDGDTPLGVPMTITNAEYRVNGGEWTAVGEDVQLGDVIQIRVMSSGSTSTAIVATLDINGVTADFSVTTKSSAPDITPDAFVFTDATDQALESYVESNTITVTGIDSPAPFEVVAGQFSKNGGAWENGVAVPGTGPVQYCELNDTIKLRVLTEPSYNATSNSTLNINGVSDTFSATTVAAGTPDTTPDAFTFIDVSNVELSTSIESNQITVLGIDSPSAMTISGGEYSVNGQAWSSAGQNVVLNDRVRVRVTSSGSYSTGASATLTIGGVSDTFTATTIAAPPASTTTLLTQPDWLEVPEDYGNAKLGLAYYRANYRTQFLADTGGGSVLTATNTSELNTHIATAKGNTAISAIDLTSGNYTWTAGTLSGLSRPVNNPLVIRTKAGEPTQAIISRINEHDGDIAGVAFVDLDITNGLSMRGAYLGTDTIADVLVERCNGWVEFQGCRLANNTPGNPATNIQLRLNTHINHWLPSSALAHGIFAWNIEDMLIEGNVIDHNGWSPNSDRTLPSSQGGPDDRSHNVYISRPSSGVVIRYNVNSRPSSHCWHTKGGAYNYRNLNSLYPIGTQLGYGRDNYFALYGLVNDSRCENNVFVGTDDISPSAARGQATILECCNAFQLTGNLFLYDHTTFVNSATALIDRQFPLNGFITNNRAYGWTRNLVYGITNNYTPDLSISGNDWSLTSITGAAQSLAYQLGGDPVMANNHAAIDSYVASRHRQGVDIAQLQDWMDDLQAGVS